MKLIHNNKLININNFLKEKNYKKALDLIEELEKSNFDNKEILKVKNKIFLETKNWLNYKKNNIKLLALVSYKNKIYYNIGVACFNLGNLRDACNYFNKSLNTGTENYNCHISLGLTYKSLGKYKDAIRHFNEAQILNNKNFFVRENIIDCLNYIDLTNSNIHLVQINNKIKQKNYNFKIIKDLNNLKEIIQSSEKILKNYLPNIFVQETQIFRKEDLNLNCKRHMAIFNKYDVIPNYCFGCFKIQINIKDVVNLIKLYFLFNSIQLEKDTLRKCMIELRENSSGFYKGYIYVTSLDKAKIIFEFIKSKLDNEKIETLEMSIKHGCNEYYEKYPIFKKLELETKDLIYKKEWELIEKNYDFENNVLKLEKNKIYSKTLNQFNLSDYLIIKNWLLYAKHIGDTSYQRIFSDELYNPHFKNFLENKSSKNYLRNE